METAGTMAFFKDLAQVIARVEGMDEMTVIGIGQYLRDAGLIKKGGRGLSAARMTPSDAANLLIAVNATSVAKNAVEVVRQFSGLHAVQDGFEITPRAQRYSGEEFEQIKSKIGEAKTFNEFLPQLISLFVPDTSGKSMFEAVFPNGITVTRLEFARPMPVALFRVEKFGMHQYAAKDFPDTYVALRFILSAEDMGPYIGPDASDKFEKTSIGRKTLDAVGQVLAT